MFRRSWGDVHASLSFTEADPFRLVENILTSEISRKLVTAFDIVAGGPGHFVLQRTLLNAKPPLTMLDIGARWAPFFVQCQVDGGVLGWRRLLPMPFLLLYESDPILLDLRCAWDRLERVLPPLIVIVFGGPR